jgi:hypothetical protein
MLQGKSHILLLTALAILFLAMPCRADTGSLYLELIDKLTRNTAKIYFSELGMRIEERRESKITRFDLGKVAYVNSSNSTYTEKTFNEMETLRRLRKKYNEDILESSDYKKDPILVLSAKPIEIKNLAIEGTVIRYRILATGQVMTIVGARISSPGFLNGILSRNEIAARMLENYFTSHDIALLKSGFIPIRTVKLYDLAKVQSGPANSRILEIPANFRKRDSGEYYKDMAVEMIGEATKKSLH